MSELMRTLPASWYCSPPLYQLERRAVFLKVWLKPILEENPSSNKHLSRGILSDQSLDSVT